LPSQLPVRLDLHVHTRRYSPCAPSLVPTQTVDLINCGCLEGIVVTDHDVLWAPEEIQALNTKLNRGRIYRGVEVSSCNGHFILIGVDDVQTLHPGDPLEKIQALAHAQGGVVIWAHPHQRYHQITDPIEGQHLPAGIDAIEVTSTVTSPGETKAAHRLARRHLLTMVGGSDAHCLAAVGQVLTCFKRLPPNEAALAEMIRGGDCTPCTAALMQSAGDSH
jgi:predicted metal-dependent phosphoesterase TrpH